MAGDAAAAHKMLHMALADLPNHPQIMAAIASIETRGLCPGPTASSANDACSPSASNSLQYEDVLVKHGKRQLRVSYAPSLGGAAAWASIACSLDLDPSKMKLLLRGANLQPLNIVSAAWRIRIQNADAPPWNRQVAHLAKARACDVVLAVGQPLEKEDGCDEAVSSTRPLLRARATVEC